MDKLNRLKAVLHSYGADPARWPEVDRAALAGTLEDHGDLVAEYRAATEIDQVLGAATRPAVPAGAHARLAELARELPPQAADVVLLPQQRAFGVSRFAAISTLAASLCIGIYLGALGTLDPILEGDSPFDTTTELDDFDDPFEFESLIGSNGEGTG
ncbi:MAG: hypothetical protein HKN11_01100 [Rhizobiales bacterium]|nr:hypothetical protein [Hyphomicrobiales bacterium]